MTKLNYYNLKEGNKTLYFITIYVGTTNIFINVEEIFVDITVKHNYTDHDVYEIVYHPSSNPHLRCQYFYWGDLEHCYNEFLELSEENDKTKTYLCTNKKTVLDMIRNNLILGAFKKKEKTRTRIHGYYRTITSMFYAHPEGFKFKDNTIPQ